MLAKIFSAANIGLEAKIIEVEVDIPNEGLPAFNIVGLPGKAVEESKERVRSAIKNSGASFPTTRLTVNLAPADLPKSGPAYDLPIALGILIASGQLQLDTENSLFVGELSLDGNLRPINGLLPITFLAREKGFKKIFVPVENTTEAAVVDGIKIYAIESLLQLVRFLSGNVKLESIKNINLESILKTAKADFDFSEVIGQETAKRALTIAAAGGHNVYMQGVPGSGKTMLSRALPGILPRLTKEEAIEVTKIYSVTGNLTSSDSLVLTRPFRSPHHTTSRIGLIGGGSNPAPGEISLAHRGVLFMDEFPEFPRSVLEALRQPIEDGVVTISRAKASVKYPSEFLLVAAANPCPCGYFGDKKRACKCLPGQISRYRKRVSGPMMDRIDIHLSIQSVEPTKLINTDSKGERSKEIQKRVQNARDIQSRRYVKEKIKSNSGLSSRQIKKYCPLDQDSMAILRSAVATLNLSARSFHKTIKVARTIADLAGEKNITKMHVSEALQYRPKVEKVVY